MRVAVGELSARVAAALGTEAGQVRLRAAVSAVLELDGAPTRPAGQRARLRDRLTAGEPLAEDTDWRAPLGPFRDTSLVAGTIGELCAARLVIGGTAGDRLVESLASLAAELGADVLADAVDAAEAAAACRAGVAAALTGALAELRLSTLLA